MIKGSIRSRSLSPAASRSSRRPAPVGTSSAPSAAASAAASTERRSAPQRRLLHAAKQYTIGFSNSFGIGNGFREEQLCTAKAQALGVGPVSDWLWTHQAEDTDLQAKPRHPGPDRRGRQRDRLQPQRQGGAQFGAPGGEGSRDQDVAIDAYVTDPDTYNLYNNQVSTPSSAPSGCSSRWAALARCGTRAVSPATRPTTTVTSGFKNVLSDYPNIKVAAGSGWCRHRLGSREGHLADQRLHLRAVGTTSPGDLGLRHGQADHRCDQGRRQEPFVPIADADLGGSSASYSTL